MRPAERATESTTAAWSDPGWCTQQQCTAMRRGRIGSSGCTHTVTVQPRSQAPDHDTDSYYKISRAFIDGKPVGNLTRETIVDNITLYWLTGTGTSAARWYWEFGQVLAAAVRAARLLRRSRFPSASRRSPARSGLPRAAGLRRFTPGSPTSTRSTAADTSQRGRNPISSLVSSALRLDPRASSHGLASPVQLGGPDRVHSCSRLLRRVAASAASLG